jgi:uncharacterized protein (DUF2336 family)
MTNPRSAAAASRPSPPPALGIVRRFLVWAQWSGPAERADGASALARAYLHADMTAALREDCALALATLLDDPSVGVRRALAEAFAGALGAPRALVVALANDRSEVAAPLLARSPLLTDAELVDCAAAGDALAQCAVARRPGLAAGPAAALAEVGTRDAALALIANPGAVLTRGSLSRLTERFADDIEFLHALAARTDLPAHIQAGIAIATSRGPAETSEAPRERSSRDAALAVIAAGRPEDELFELVRTLKGRGALTMALFLRSLLGGERGLFAAALAELAGLPRGRVTALLRDPDGAGFAAAATKAGLPRHALTVFRAALRAIAVRGAGEDRRLSSDLVGAVIKACEAEHDPKLAPFLAFLWRLAAESARADARAKTRSGHVLPPRLDFAPANDGATADDVAPPVELPADLVLALDAA